MKVQTFVRQTLGPALSLAVATFVVAADTGRYYVAAAVAGGELHYVTNQYRQKWAFGYHSASASEASIQARHVCDSEHDDVCFAVSFSGSPRGGCSAVVEAWVILVADREKADREGTWPKGYSSLIGGSGATRAEAVEDARERCKIAAVAGRLEDDIHHWECIFHGRRAAHCSP